MNRKELQSLFEGKLNEFKMIDSRIEELRKKLQQAKTIDDDSLMQINMGICVFSVSKERAVQILSEAIEIEQNYQLVSCLPFNGIVKPFNRHDSINIQ